jgi:tetratricopeptide (TPR) repeat protein
VPLALELAAARVRALTVEQIATRLDDRFRLLTGSSRITVPRHQTLRATIDWSYDLLTEDERAIFRRLSVFAGGCTLEAAEAVCAADPVAEPDVLDLLSRLVDKSLVIAETALDEGRFRLLETVRQYARTPLVEAGEATDTLRRHRDWYLVLVERAAPEFFRGPESSSWLKRLDREHDNLRVALQWSEDEPGEQADGLRLAAALWRFWEIHGDLIEGRGWLERMLARTKGELSALRANALTGAGVLAFTQGDYRGAATFHEESLSLHRRLGDPHSISYAANNLANAALLEGDHATARELYEESILISKEMGDLRGAAFGLINMADVVARAGNDPAARALFDESIATFRQFGDRWGEAFALDSFAVVVCRQGDYESAEALHQQALAISRELDDGRRVARALMHLADVAARRGHFDQAKSQCRESLAIRQELRDMPGLASAMENLAWIVMVEDPDSAARLVGSAEALREAIRAPVPPSWRADYEARLRSLQSRLEERRFEAARNLGRTMAPAEALATIPR